MRIEVASSGKAMLMVVRSSTGSSVLITSSIRINVRLSFISDIVSDLLLLKKQQLRSPSTSVSGEFHT